MSQLPIVQALDEGYLADAHALVRAGVATPADINIAMRLGAGYPSGPFDEVSASASESASDREPESPSGWDRVAVLGTGHMAAGIAESVARAGKNVVVIGRTEDSVLRVGDVITASLGRAVSRGRLTAEQADEVTARITLTAQMSTGADADLVIEAVAEDLAVKSDVLAQAHEVFAAESVFATNTSSFRVAEVMAHVPKTRRTLALHFFNPAVVMKLIEVVAGPSDEDVSGLGTTWAREIGKVPVRSADERGFIVNRLLIPYLNDAVRLHEGGYDVDEIDLAMTTERGLPMGPFALIDLIGVDVTVAALDSLAAAADADERIRPAGTLRRMVSQGRLGRKTGQGFR